MASLSMVGSRRKHGSPMSDEYSGKSANATATATATAVSHPNPKSSTTMIEAIVHYKRRIEHEKNNDEKILHALKKLRRYPMDAAALKVTDVLTTVYGLKKRNGEVGSLSRSLVHDWKKLVSTTANGSSSSSTTTTTTTTTSSSKVRVVKSKSDHAITTSTTKNPDHKKIPIRVEISPTKSKSTSSPSKLKSSRSERTPSKSADNRKQQSVDGEGSLTSIPANLVDVSSSVDQYKPKKTKSTTKRLVDAGGDGFDATMASFEDCLGLNDFNSKSSTQSSSKSGTVVERKKMKRELTLPLPESSKTKSKSKSKRNPPSSSLPSLLAVSPIELNPSSTPSLPSTKPFASHVDILASLSTDYKPMRFPLPEDSPPSKFKKDQFMELGTTYLSPRNKRTQVFSGRRSHTTITQVSTLLKSCIKVLQENVDVLSDLLYAPYEHLKPVLLRCTPDRLLYLEEMNPYLLEDTDELWRLHCQREFKGYEPDEFESWRELYYRMSVDRSSRLRSITAHISASMAKAVPVRQTKLAFLDCEAKPPRQVARQQAKFGTGQVKNETPVGLVKLGKSKATNTNTINNSLARISSSEAASSSVSSNGPTSGSQLKAVKKVAPLMQKTLKFMKNRFRR